MLASVIIGVLTLLFIVLVLTTLLMVVKACLQKTEQVTIQINDRVSFQVSSGETLLSTLAQVKVFLPSACGGGGTCGLCRCRVLSGGGERRPAENGFFDRQEQNQGWRLGCQLKVGEDLKITVPDSILTVEKRTAKVISNYQVATFIKELVLEIEEPMSYQPGGYLQVEIPPYELSYRDIEIQAHPDEHAEVTQFEKAWDSLRTLSVVHRETTERAYSMASYPEEGAGTRLMLNIRVATPTWNEKTESWKNVQPGIGSSYLFSKKPGEKVVISGPYGDFFIQNGVAEMLYIGGGAGMAPLRSHLFYLFKTLRTGRQVTYWYGGRSREELFYLDHFLDLEKNFPNFRFFVALSNPLPKDHWIVKKDLNDQEGEGFVGFIHEVVEEQYLRTHPSPQSVEFYLCGPPLMTQAVLAMCDRYCVPKEKIRYDDFGGAGLSQKKESPKG